MRLVAATHPANMYSSTSSGAPLRIEGEANLPSVSRVTRQGVGGFVALLSDPFLLEPFLPPLKSLPGPLENELPLLRLHLLASHGASAAHSRFPPAWLCRAIGDVKYCSWLKFSARVPHFVAVESFAS